MEEKVAKDACGWGVISLIKVNWFNQEKNLV